MKTIFFLGLLFSCVLTRAQNVLRVNNTPGVNAPYTTIAAAVAAAGATDIIQVESSLISYGDVTISKKVTIVGPGYFLTENLNLQATVQSASLGAVTLTSTAIGSSFSGLTFTGQPGITINGASNISITHSNFANCRGVQLNGTGTNVLVGSNYHINAGCQGLVEAGGANYTGVVVINNYTGGVNTGSTSVFTIKHNVFTAGSIIQNSDVRNNIFTYTGGFGTPSSSIIKNNVFTASSQTGADGTNVFNQTAASLFAGLAGNTVDTQWRLNATSSALTAGEGGAECGMYGGLTPYKPSGIQTGQPTITNVSMPNSIPQNGTLNVKVSAKVN